MMWQSRPSTRPLSSRATAKVRHPAPSAPWWAGGGHPPACWCPFLTRWWGWCADALRPYIHPCGKYSFVLTLVDLWKTITTLSEGVSLDHWVHCLSKILQPFKERRLLALLCWAFKDWSLLTLYWDEVLGAIWRINEGLIQQSCIPTSSHRCTSI